MEEEVIRETIEAENGVERGKLQNQNEAANGEKIPVKRGKLNSVTIYDVTENELIILEKGSDASVWLNFLIFSVSVALSFLVSVLTADWSNNDITYIIFICVVIMMSVFALVCFVLWLRGRGQHKTTIKKIRERSEQIVC